ncbi:MAG: ParB N-terminal domain-containing protein, partial [Thermoplasmata archaeon]
MTSDPEFDLVPIEELHSHEEIDEENVVELIAEITRAGVFADPIWASRGSLVILNGHHRVEALRRIGAHRVPTWLFEYETDVVSLEPWRPGLPITKAEVVRRGLGGHLFPAKTTRHKIRVELPPRPTPLAELIPAPRRAPD